MPREIWHVLSTTCLRINQKAHITYNFNFFENEDFSRSQTVTYTVNVVIISGTVLDGVVTIQTTNRK